jgi:hypothetical protein
MNLTGACVCTPPFGEPLIELTQEVGQVWLGIVRPLAVRYGVFDETRVVMVTEAPVLLPKSDPQGSR